MIDAHVDFVDVGMVDAGGGRLAAVEVLLRKSQPFLVMVTVEFGVTMIFFEDVRDLVECELGAWIDLEASQQSCDEVRKTQSYRFYVLLSRDQPTHCLQYGAIGAERTVLVRRGSDMRAFTHRETIEGADAEWICDAGTWKLNGAAPDNLRVVDLPLVSWRDVPIPSNQERIAVLAACRRNLGAAEQVFGGLPPISWVGFPLPSQSELNTLRRLSEGAVGISSVESVRARARLRDALSSALYASDSVSEAAELLGVSRAYFYVLLASVGVSSPVRQPKGNPW